MRLLNVGDYGEMDVQYFAASVNPDAPGVADELPADCPYAFGTMLKINASSYLPTNDGGSIIPGFVAPLVSVIASHAWVINAENERVYQTTYMFVIDRVPQLFLYEHLSPIKTI